MPPGPRRPEFRRNHSAATYTAAARAIDAPFEPGLISISDRMQESGDDYAGAVVFLEDPANRTMCETCGWTFGMVCPECSGCGCDSGCTGWRHREFADADDERYAEVWCEECGADSHYQCSCA